MEMIEILHELLSPKKLHRISYVNFGNDQNLTLAYPNFGTDTKFGQVPRMPQINFSHNIQSSKVNLL